jgi:antitoxin component of MazEF toxin-antitoxin module
MRARLERTDKGMALVIPPKMLAACGIGEEANVTVQHGTLLVTAPGWKPRQGWEEALANLDPGQLDVSGEDSEVLAYWNSPA